MLQNMRCSLLQWLDQPRLSPDETFIATTVSLPCCEFSCSAYCIPKHPLASERHGVLVARPHPVLELIPGWQESEGRVSSEQCFLVCVSFLFFPCCCWRFFRMKDKGCSMCSFFLHEPCWCESRVSKVWNLISWPISSPCVSVAHRHVFLLPLTGCTVVVEPSWN